MLSRFAISAGRRTLLSSSAWRPLVSSAVAQPLSTSASASQSVKLEKQGEITVIKIDIPNAKENTLNADLTREMTAVMDKLESDDSVKGIVVMSGKPNSFVAGADINMLKAAKSAEEAEALAR
ncbi:hypothetical protein WR25_06199 [Diploscapter pachys]|uniref:3-hydroxyacyl-CoA dehydrogenase NAD binding domain-containing protein n=1 Tax=Diploscapter pachys TaxID=2018661 RepID=A0A2A2KMX9_9BILA|nr:hypothetical protein WR25_06199 [Diploscapter pachys]